MYGSYAGRRASWRGVALVVGTVLSLALMLALARTFGETPRAAASGPIEVSKGVQQGRLARTGTASRCAVSSAAPARVDGESYDYHAHTYVNGAGRARCLTVTLQPAANCVGNHFVAAYGGRFDPNAITTNYLADAGVSSPIGRPLSFGVTVPARALLILVVINTLGGEVCDAYDLRVLDSSGLAPAPAPSPTPSPTPTSTSTPSPTPTSTPSPTPAPTPSPTPSATPRPSQPDVNGDGSVTATDALCILRQLGGFAATQACADPLPFPDVNFDNQVTSVDALCVLRYLGGFPVTTGCPLAPAGGTSNP